VSEWQKIFRRHACLALGRDYRYQYLKIQKKAGGKGKQLFQLFGRPERRDYFDGFCLLILWQVVLTHSQVQTRK